MPDTMPWEDFGAATSQSNMPWEDFQSQMQPQKQVGILPTISDQALEGATFGLGNRASAGLAALGAKAYQNLPEWAGGNPNLNESIGDLYKEARGIESDRLKQEQQEHPWWSIGSNLAGGLGTGGLLGDTAAGSAIANNLRSGGTLARIGKGALAGATTGAAYGAGTADYDKTLEGAKQGALYGGITGGALPVAGAALSDVGGTLANTARGLLAKSPEVVQNIAKSLKSGASDIYEQMRQVGAYFNPSSTQTLLRDIDSALSKRSFIPENNANTVNIVNALKERAANGTLSLGDLDQYRSQLYNVPHGHDMVAAGDVRKAIDSFVNKTEGKNLVGGLAHTPQDLQDAQDELGKLQDVHDDLVNSIQQKSQLAGQQGGFWRRQSQTEAADEATNLANIKQQITRQQQKIADIQQNLTNAPQVQKQAEYAVSLLNQGRKQYQMASKYGDIADIIQKADGDPNKLRSFLKTFANNEDNLVGWSDAEKAALKNAYQYGVTGGLLKMFGKFGIDLGRPNTMGNAIGPLIGYGVSGGNILAPIAGTIARAGQTLSAKGGAQNLLNVIQKGGSNVPKNINPVSSLFSIPAGAAIGGLESHQPVNSLPQPVQKLQTQPISANKQPFNTSMQDGLMQAFAKAESGNNPSAKNPISSASGLMQFTDDTWKQMVKRYGDQTGIGLQDKNDPKAQQTMAMLYAKDNLNRMEPFLKRNPTKGELYQAHMLGADGALRLINAANNQPDKQAFMLFPKAVTNGNKNIFFDKDDKPRTVAEVYKILSNKVE